ncbi:MAG: hypothetical protein PWQ96_524 [Clostridia bacterium]|jgi:hypothetical protein|nr:YolD-like protein [Clostridiales bacterium]MDK2984882.1 hypothetical protein [Clostridia bacterium]
MSSKKIYDQFTCSRMMLPEHKERLKNYRKKLQQKEKYRMPLFDEQQWEEFQFILEHSLHYDAKIQLTILQEESYLEVQGVVKGLDTVKREITIATESGLRKLNAKEIVNIDYDYKKTP